LIYHCVLPFPVSVNSAYGNRSNQQRFKSKAYKAWEKSCPALLLPQSGCIDWPVRVVYNFFMPDKRVRDIGNYEKVTTDMLVKQAVLFDDSTKVIQSIALNYCGIDRDNSRVEIEIYNV